MTPDDLPVKPAAKKTDGAQDTGVSGKEEAGPAKTDGEEGGHSSPKREPEHIAANADTGSIP